MNPRLIACSVAALLGLGAAAAAAGPAVTLYTQDLGYVRETRSLTLGSARDTLRLDGVPERLDFSSVRLSPADPATRVARLAFHYDVTNGEVLLERSLGQRVRVTTRGDRVSEGTLVAGDGSWLVVRGDDGALQNLARSAIEVVRLAASSASLSLRPSLEAVLEGGKRGKVEAELAYLTGGLSWSAEHTLVRRGESGGSWSSAVTVNNQSGVTFADATVKLVAGEPRRAGPIPAPMPKFEAMQMRTMAADAGAAMSEQAFADYHLYTLGRPATLRDRETQSLVMHDPRDIKLAPRYFYRGGDARGVTTQLEIRNESASGLGMAIPGGRVRIYEADPSGALQFTGEAAIGHTAEGEKLTLDVGQAFDLVAERREMSNRRVSDREREYSVEIKLRNRKKTAVTIVVQEGAGGETELLKQSHPSTRKDANTIEFEIPVAAGKETVLSYTARVRY